LLTQVYGRSGQYYLLYDQPDAAISNLQKSVAFAGQADYKHYEGEYFSWLGVAYINKGNYALAKTSFLNAQKIHEEQNDQTGLAESYLSLADLYKRLNNNDSCLYYAKKGLALSKITNEFTDEVKAYSTLSDIFKQRNNIDSAYKYQSLALTARDSLGNAEKVKKFENIGFAEQLRLQQLEEEKAAIQIKIRTYSMLAALGVFLLIALILYLNNRQKQKANLLLNEQKEEIQVQRDNLGHALEELKNTQTQLVQREKMASLGELTAGIAHEIQNPLNFVNNFSEVNKEMLEELKAESIKPKAERDEQLEIDLINDLIENESKINHHGKRADFIVKGMLEHSRASTGEKQPTDFNVLCDEFMKLSYHGLRAKDKNFNAELITHFDTQLPKIKVAQQDIGRVLLNLFNNAFYAVTTASENGQLVIRVKDNGNGIPDAIKDKIMQPFFTTKPTGEGTGLGLSLSYDIVVKGHGGTVDLKSTEGEGAEFILRLPF
jgi:two-component system NtrC family sensor kinase